MVVKYKALSSILIAFVLLCFSAASASAGIKVRTICEASFLLTQEVDPITQTADFPFSVFTLPKDTEVELLAFEAFNNDMLTVRLQDGSIGYMSVHRLQAFCR